MTTGEKRARAQNCLVPVSGATPCGRPSYDADGRCICHSTDPGKDLARFGDEVEKELAGQCNFTRFVFPAALDFSQREFAWNARFTNATFHGPASFSDARFKRDVLMDGAEFHGRAGFEGASFGREATFQGAHFRGTAVFKGTRFHRDAVLSAAFHDSVDFSDAVFRRGASFDGGQFRGAAVFQSTSFGELDTFTETSFRATTFQRGGCFTLARFYGRADFTGATFKDSANFLRATFHKEASFFHMSFDGEAIFADATFGAAVSFVGERINVVKDGVPQEPIENRVFSSYADTYFRHAILAQPTQTVFHHVYLGRTRFLNTDVWQVDFTDVDWAKRSGGHFAVWDELSPEEDGKDYRLIGKLYRQLKHNYEERRDPITAGDFHMGEMEMRRLAATGCSERFCLWLYKWISGYGESYMLALGRILLVIFIFAALTWSPGLAIKTSGDGGAALGVRDVLPRLLYSAMCFLLRGDRPFEPVALAGHCAAVLEGIIGPALIAMFVLALNRRFKR